MRIGILDIVMLVALCTAGSGAGTLYYRQATKIYTARSKVLIKSDSSADPRRIFGNTKNEIFNKIELLRTEFILIPVAQELQAEDSGAKELVDDVLKGCGNPTMATSRAQCIADFLSGNLGTRIVPNASAVEVTLSSRFPLQAVPALAVVLDVWTKKDRETLVNQYDVVLNELEKKVDVAEAHFDEARRDYERFIIANPTLNDAEVVALSDVSRSIDQKMIELKAQLAALPPRLNEVDTPAKIGRASGLKLNPRQEQLARELVDNIATEAMRTTPARIQEGVRIHSLIDQLQEQKRTADQRLSQLPPQLTKLALLRRAFESSERLLTSVQQEVTTARITLAPKDGGILVVDRPRPGTTPQWPQIKVVRFWGFIGGVVVFFVIFLMKMRTAPLYLKGSVRGLRTAGTIPQIRLPRTWLLRRDHEWTTLIKGNHFSQVSRLFTSFERILHLVERSKAAPNRLVTVASHGPRHGKSFVSFGIAMTFAARPNTHVLLVDLDLRRNGRKFLDGTYPPGRVSVTGYGPHLLGKVTLGVSAGSGVDILQPKVETPSAAALRAIIDGVSGPAFAAYDHIIFDLPPVGLFSDAFEAALCSDTTFVITVDRESTLESVETVFNEMKMLGVPEDKIWAITNMSRTPGRRMLGDDYKDYRRRSVRIAGPSEEAS